MSTKNNQSGQIAIVILLIMVVLLTVGLSLASRTTQEIFLSTQEAESARVFNAAESGVESALSQNFSEIAAEGNSFPVDDPLIANVDITTTINPNDELVTQITEGSTVHIDLGGYSNNFDVEWGNNGCTNVASIIASVYYYDATAGETKVIHDAFTTDPNPQSPDDEFSTAGGSSTNYCRSHTVDLSGITVGANELRFARIKAIYEDTSLKVSGTNFPTQFFTIRADADNQLGEETRSIEVGRTLSTAPGFMDYAVYSGGSLQHN